MLSRTVIIIMTWATIQILISLIHTKTTPTPLPCAGTLVQDVAGAEPRHGMQHYEENKFGQSRVDIVGINVESWCSSSGWYCWLVLFIVRGSTEYICSGHIHRGMFLYILSINSSCLFVAHKYSHMSTCGTSSNCQLQMGCPHSHFDR